MHKLLIKNLYFCSIPKLFMRYNLYYTSPHNLESFMNGTSSTYIEDMYQVWRTNPINVHASWDAYFRGVEANRPIGSSYVSPPSLNLTVESTRYRRNTVTREADATVNESTIREYLEIQSVIQSFRLRGHLAATLDPLEIVRGPHLKAARIRQHVLRHYKIPKDLTKEYMLHNSDFIGGGEKALPLGEILKRLEIAYCGNIGVEYMHISDQERLNFIRHKFETPGARIFDPLEKRLILKRLIRAYRFEDYLAKKYPSEKRFGLEGGEVLIPAVKTMIDTASARGVDIFNIGIAHRGRLNILANVVRKSLTEIFSQFRPISIGEGEEGSGDVKYHLGTYVERINSQTKRPIVVSVTANPSHLEVVNPIVAGKTYAEKIMIGDKAGDKAWSILIHGDAATSGQGIVYETFHLSELPCFTNHGSIHIIINNQIGFTTDPRVARSSEYCTAVAKVTSAPVFHVNGDDPESVCYVMKVATEYKLKFKTDAVVDINCYRKHGHSEADQPKFTQPLMYKIIDKIIPINEKFSKILLSEGVVTKEELEAMDKYAMDWLHEGFESAQKVSEVKKKDWLDSPWKNFFKPEKDPLFVPYTGTSKEVLLKIGEAVSTIPQNFEIHKALAKVLNQRKKMIENNSVDWALGEAFAIGSLKQEGFNVRLTGQDVERGTFSHRHHIYHHQTEDQVTYRPLHTLFPDGGQYTICNSSLSEFGVFGFELGYSMVSPYNLVMWEAQFGDFANSAQIIVDQFLSSGEQKWGRQTGLVQLLPHGLEGQGPEHSSARPERYLQLCSESSEPNFIDDMPQQMVNANWFVANVTTPANLFHILRRQLKLNYRKPLILFTPKSILRHPEAQSTLDDMVGDTKFKPYLKDITITSPSSVEKVLLCTGKVYYELKEERRNRNLESKIALCRIEQLFPFPYSELRDDTKMYPNAKMFWVQEEHRNQGYWQYVQQRILFAAGRSAEYYGRPPSAAPSTGNKLLHKKEVKDFMNQCFS